MIIGVCETDCEHCMISVNVYHPIARVSNCYTKNNEQTTARYTERLYVSSCTYLEIGFPLNMRYSTNWANLNNYVV